MDGERFDALVRALATPHPRRTAVRALAGLALGGTLALRGGRSAGAVCPAGQVLAAKDRCVCTTTGRPPGSSGCPCPACPSGAASDPATCACVCADGRASCGSGAKATCCPAGKVCEDPSRGRCDVPPGSVLTGGRCDEDADCQGSPCCQSSCCAGGAVCSTVSGACCTPLSVCQPTGVCGPIPDGCGGTVECNCLGPTDRCIGGACCTSATVCREGACGPADDGCDGTVDCGACTLPETCGGGGVLNVCGCTPACDGATCGAADGCGGACQTGSCPVCQACDQGVCQPVESDSACEAGCVGGICQSVCLPVYAEHCTASDQCCQVHPTICQETIIAGLTWCCRAFGEACEDLAAEHGEGTTCCRYPGQEPERMGSNCYGGVCCASVADNCSSTAMCCQSPASLTCQIHPNPLCANELGGKCCKPTGAACDGSTTCECCDGYCVDGFCSPACKPDRTACNSYLECCSWDCDNFLGYCV